MEPLPPHQPFLTTITTDAEAAGRWVANALSRWHLNGWVALGIAVAANIIGVVFHV